MVLGAGIWAWRLRFGPLGRDLGLLAEIWASRQRFGPGLRLIIKPRGDNGVGVVEMMGFGPRGWDLGLEPEI